MTARYKTLLRKELNRTDRIRQHTELYRQPGVSMRDIAKVTGWNIDTISKDIHRAIDASNAESGNALKIAIATELSEAVKGLSNGTREGDPASITALVRVADRICKMFGLDAPAKQEVTGKDGAPLGATTPADARRAMAQFFGEHVSRTGEGTPTR